MNESDQIRGQHLRAMIAKYNLGPGPGGVSPNSTSGEGDKLANALHFEVGRKLEGYTGLGAVLSLLAQRGDLPSIQAWLAFFLVLFFSLSTFSGIYQDLRDHYFFRHLSKGAERTETSEWARRAQWLFAGLGGIVVLLFAASALSRSLTPSDEYYCRVRPISDETKDEFAIQAPLSKVRLLRIVRCD